MKGEDGLGGAFLGRKPGLRAGWNCTRRPSPQTLGRRRNERRRPWGGGDVFGGGTLWATLKVEHLKRPCLLTLPRAWKGEAGRPPVLASPSGSSALHPNTLEALSQPQPAP